MKKRLFGILLSLAMVLTMMPAMGMSQTAYAQEYSPSVSVSPKYTGDIEIIRELSGGRWIYRAIPETGWTFHQWTYTESGNIVISSTNPLTIEQSQLKNISDITAHFKTEGKPVYYYPLWVGGERVTSENATDTAAHPTWSYDVENETLTLNDYNNNDAVHEYIGTSAGIYAKQDLKIEATGTNSITNPAIDSYRACCIYVEGNLIIEGSGTVNNTASGNFSAAIYADNSVNIKGAELTAIGGVYGISSSNNDISISDASVNSTARSEDGYAFFTEKNIDIQNSSLSAKGGRCAALADDIVITNSKMEGTEGLVYALSKLTIEDSEIDVKINNNYYSAIQSDNRIDIKYTGKGKYRTRVEATVIEANMNGVSAMEKRPVAAILADKDGLTVDDDLSIIEPKGGKIGNYTEEYNNTYATVLDGDKIAKHVIIEAPKHDITVEKTTGGDVKVEPEKAAEGEEVKVVATPDDGYEVEKIVIIDADGKETDITDKASFIMGKKNVTVRVTFKKKTTPTPPTPSKAKPVSVVKGIAKGKTSLKFTWNKVEGAAKYELWMSKCNTAKKKYTVKRVKKLGADKTTYTRKKLRPNTAYKFRVVAKDASGKVISKSRICHAYTGNVKGKRTNVKSLKLTKKSFTLNKGGTAKIKATQTKARLGKKLCSHARKLRYRSNNTSVAKVDKSGKIKAVGTGECKIYVQAVNGIWKIVKVTVN